MTITTVEDVVSGTAKQAVVTLATEQLVLSIRGKLSPLEHLAKSDVATVYQVVAISTIENVIGSSASETIVTTLAIEYVLSVGAHENTIRTSRPSVPNFTAASATPLPSTNAVVITVNRTMILLILHSFPISESTDTRSHHVTNAS